MSDFHPKHDARPIARLIWSPDERDFNGDKRPPYYVVPPIYGMVGQYFQTSRDACDWADTMGWQLK